MRLYLPQPDRINSKYWHITLYYVMYRRRLRGKVIRFGIAFELADKKGGNEVSNNSKDSVEFHHVSQGNIVSKLWDAYNRFLDNVNFKGMITPSGKKLHDVWHQDDWFILIDNCNYPSEEERQRVKSIHRLNSILQKEL
jgi:hypothetical protein